MTREEKIQAIYKEMANKELTLGCKVKIKYDNISYGEALEEIRNPVEEILTVSLGGVARKGNIEIEKYQILSADSNGYIEDLETLVEIIGHPLMIGDVLYYIRKKYWNNYSWFHSDRSKLIDLRSKEREPIEGQYDECIDFVYSLLPKRVLDSISKK